VLTTVPNNQFQSNNKILFVGNNDESSDNQVSDLAKKYGTINHGLISSADFVPVQPGYYHTTVVDIPWGGLLELADKFDSIVMLDQPQSQWSHWKCFQATFKLMCQLETLNKHTVFRNNDNVKKILYWSDLVYNKNKSFCIYPFINFSNNGKDFKLCSRDTGTVTTTDKLDSWTTDPSYTQIRNKMIKGEKLPDHCSVCYNYEKNGIESYRQFETMDWVTQLDLKNVDDLAQLNRPYFYEMHIGNHCNIKCRHCTPSSSQPIARELKKFKIITPVDFTPVLLQASIDQIDIDNLDKKSSVYFQGGEPTIMPEVIDFMKRCIAKNKTDFFLTMCTNGVKLSTEFVELIGNFSNTNFSFSIDGYSKINDYWRSGSNWNKIIENAHFLQSQGHSISINTVPGIYNVTNLHLLFEFLDQEFPFTSIYLQINYFPWQSAFNHPLKELVIESMSKCMKTSVYHSNGKSCKSGIDSIYNHYSNNPIYNKNDLKNFFDYNDQLDLVRGTKLIDFIPELEAARKYIDN
jgi:sulfatase maturation enzyme AslB (radical SAM superfamily)